MDQSRKKVSFSSEKLHLVCEWENCNVIEANIEIFLSHIASVHLVKIDPDDLHCHWKECEGFTDNLSELRRHILLHAFHSKIKCYGANLQARKNISNCLCSAQSRNIVPELPDPLVCCWEECKTLYESPEHFYRHVDTHAVYDSKKGGNHFCLWQDCKRTFSDQSKVREHLRSHTQEKIIACPTCGGMFASRTKFFDHIQRQLSNDKAGSYICEYCPAQLNSERLLRDHMRHHVNHYKCPYCDMTCPTPSGLGSHIAYRHSEEKQYSCQYCDYKCKTENDLRKHLACHSLVPTYKCPVENCSYSSRSQTCYRAHYRKKHEGKKPLKYACHLCEKVFSRGNYLTKHLLKKHKFRWPSGHCRFRYCLDGEGLYKLQTVRYESLELSQEMMGENSELLSQDGENVDDPNAVNTLQQSEACESHISDSVAESHSNIVSNEIISDSSPILELDGENHLTSQEGLSVVCVPYTTETKKTEEEPVLIKILDVVPSGEQSFLQSNGYCVQNIEISNVRSIIQDSRGFLYQTVDLISQTESSVQAS